ncbi:MAG: 50S ribosomal protein L32 [Mycoplasmataceae bacterium]|jgi:large subunit ribosomal protein L32|nr:50S ribosomal protein L32 [Mycoplasmataceae bacterium]
MIVQQRRVSKSRKGMRRSHHALSVPTTVACSKCGKQIKPHTVCSYCGYYKNKKIINVGKKDA